MKPGDKDSIEKRWYGLRRALEYYGVTAPNQKVDEIDAYVLMMQEKRRWGGLTATSVSGNIEELVIDSVTMLEAVSCSWIDLLDIGSGGGLLGVVLAILCPNLRVTTAESSGRKSAFLAEAAGALGLSNIEVCRQRAERLVGLRQFDACVSRAAGRLAQLAPVALGLLRERGVYVALKSGEVEREVEEAAAAVELAGGTISSVIKPGLPRSVGAPERTSLVVIQKL